MFKNEKPPLVDNPNAPVIYADQVASVEVHGQMARITLCEFRIEQGQRVRVPVVTLVRPLDSVIEPVVFRMIQAAIEQDRAEVDAAPVHH